MAAQHGLINVTLAELSVPMLVVVPTQEQAANPEVVRLVALARAGAAPPSAG